MKTTIINVAKRGVQLAAILVCMTCLTSCSAVTSLVSLLISIPIRLVDLICP